MTTATLGGVALAPAQEFAWALTSGTNPYERAFFTSKARIDEIVKRAGAQFISDGQNAKTRTRDGNTRNGPLEFVVKTQRHGTLRVQSLYILTTIAGDENNSGVVVADRRWLLSRQHITREYNIRKASGNARLVGSARQPLNVFDSNPDLVLKRATTNNGKRWTADEILKDVLTELVGPNGFDIGELPFRNDVNDLVLDDPGNGALARVLAYLPGAEVYCDLDGRLKIYNSLDGSEARALEKAGVTLPGAQIVKVDRSFLRPKNVISLFEQEIELRLDYDEQNPKPAEGSRTAKDPPRPPRSIQNVIPVTDPTLTFNGEEVARGSWMVVADWLTAVAAKADFNAGIGALSQTIIQEEYCSGFAWLRAALVKWQTGDTDLLWDQRLGAVLNHWRRTFRILPQHMNLLRSVKAVRAAILDTENGTRGKAEAYFDYTQQPTRRSITRNEGDLGNSGWDVTGYADDIEDGKAAPADITILDAANGIFQLEFRTDPVGNTAKIVPGHILGAFPKEFPEALSIPEIWEFKHLDPAWKCSVILTVTPASPNNSGRLYAEKVALRDAVSKLPGVRDPGKAAGPDWYIKVGPNIETARFGWVDAQSTAIENALYTGAKMPDELLVNRDFTRGIAQANAARILSLLLDRHEGSTTLSMNPEIKPTGSLRSVAHSVGLDGAYTTLDLPPIKAPPDLFALLPESARKVLLREVD